MYLQIKKAELKQNGFGKNDIKVTMVGLYEDDGKRIKRVKLDENVIDSIPMMRTPNFMFYDEDGNTN